MPMCQTSRVWPSAGERATLAAPMVPPAPVAFSTTMFEFGMYLRMVSASWRATRSVGPPAAKGTTNEMGLLGMACAKAVTDRVAPRARVTSFFMGVSGDGTFAEWPRNASPAQATGLRGKYVAPPLGKPRGRAGSAVTAGVLDHLAVVGQAARRHQLDLAAQLGHITHGGSNQLAQGFVHLRCLHPQAHLVVGHLAADDQSRAADLRKTACDVGHLARVHEHATHLGGLVGAAHPALDARCRPPGGAGAGQHRREVTGAEAN